VEQRDDDGRHDCRLSENARNLNRRNAYGVSGRHSKVVEIGHGMVHKNVHIDDPPERIDRRSLEVTRQTIRKGLQVTGYAKGRS
jgi:hypothetical protein